MMQIYSLYIENWLVENREKIQKNVDQSQELINMAMAEFKGLQEYLPAETFSQIMGIPRELVKEEMDGETRKLLQAEGFCDGLKYWELAKETHPEIYASLMQAHIQLYRALCEAKKSIYLQAFDAGFNFGPSMAQKMRTEHKKKAPRKKSR